MIYEEIKKAIDYSPDTGIFSWSKSCTSKKRIGNVGSINDKGYVKIRFMGKDFAAHRLAFFYMTGLMPHKNIQVDHINCIRHDNRWENLRLATQSENQRNEMLRRNNTSGFKGVTWDKKAKKWRAKCRDGKKEVHLGFYDDLETAALAVMTFREREHKEFCNHG